MKIIAFLTTVILGYVWAHHDRSYFVYPSSWAIVAAIGLCALIISIFMGGTSTTNDLIASGSIGTFLFGLCMAVATQIWPNKYFVASCFVLGALAFLVVMWFLRVIATEEDRDEPVYPESFTESEQ